MKQTSFGLVLLLLGTAPLLSACGDDEEETQVKTEEQAPSPNTIQGYTSGTQIPKEGMQAMFQDFYTSMQTGQPDVTSIQVELKDGKLNVTYSSSAWGTVSFQQLEVQEADGKYILPAGAKSTIMMVPSQGGEAKPYEVSIVRGTVSTDFKTCEMVMQAVLGGVMNIVELTFHLGAAPAPVVS